MTGIGAESPPESLDDPRASLAEGLSAFLTRPQIDALLGEALALTKTAWVSCSGCGKRAEAQIPDAKAVVSAVSDLLTQGYGRPADQRQEQQLTVNRRVVLAFECARGHPCQECAKEASDEG